MLVLSRRYGESIMVGNVQITVLELRPNGNTVRLGVTAPPEVEVHRKEIYDAIHRRDKKGC